MEPFDRVLWIVLDSVGIGALPDAADYDDVGRNTLGHVAESRPLRLDNLVRLGLANIAPLAHLTPPAQPDGCYGKGATHSPGKDTTTGHWEMAGIWLAQAFPVYKHGFPPEIMEPFERAIGRKTLGNKPASGTEIIKELGEEHMRTGFPIVYTSGDSVFQIAAHESVIPIAELYRMCEIARKLLDGPHRVGRVIARPFTGEPGSFRRTERRHDYAVQPPRPMLLDDVVSSRRGFGGRRSGAYRLPRAAEIALGAVRLERRAHRRLGGLHENSRRRIIMRAFSRGLSCRTDPSTSSDRSHAARKRSSRRRGRARSRSPAGPPGRRSS